MNKIGGKMNAIIVTVDPPIRFKIWPNFGNVWARKANTKRMAVRNTARFQVKATKIALS